MEHRCLKLKFKTPQIWYNVFAQVYIYMFMYKSVISFTLIYMDIDKYLLNEFVLWNRLCVYTSGWLKIKYFFYMQHGESDIQNNQRAFQENSDNISIW